MIYIYSYSTQELVHHHSLKHHENNWAANHRAKILNGNRSSIVIQLIAPVLSAISCILPSTEKLIVDE
jgi:hypothetical protein